MKKYDVIICGAGPAGTIAAIQLVRSKFSVLLIDKEEFPRDKICGDQLPPSGIELLQQLDILGYDYFDSCNNIEFAEITSAFGTKIRLKFEFLSDKSSLCIIPRSQLDFKLYTKAVEEGVDFKRAKLIDIVTNKNEITIVAKNENEIQQYSANILLGADGSNSTINQILGKNLIKKRGIAIRAYVEGIDCTSNKIEGLFLKEFNNGYCWIFPLSKNTANVGLGMELSEYKIQNKSLIKILKEFLNENQIKSRLDTNYKIKSIKAFPLNIGPPDWNSLVHDRLLLLGDAASLINPVTGGGIVNAMISGKIAAEVLIEKLKFGNLDRDSLMLYSKRLKKTIGKELTISSYLYSFISNSPKRIEYIIKIASKSQLPYKILNKVFTDVKLTLE